MEQSDLDLLQTAPAYHLQLVVKTRHIPMSPKTQNSGPSLNVPSSPTSIPLNATDIAQTLFDSPAIREALGGLGEIETLILRELVECGGRANSRDLALYFTSSGLLTSGKKSELTTAYEELASIAHEPSRSYQPGIALQYPVAHPHGAFEQATRHLLLLGMLFWGKQTNFAGRDYTSGIHDGVLIVPHAVRDVVRSKWNGDSKHLIVQDGEFAGEGGRTLQRALYLYWSLVAAMREGLTLVNNGLLSRSALRHVVEHIEPKQHSEQVRTESEATRLLFIRLLLMKLGLLQERRGILYATPAEPFFALPLLERIRRCYRLYLETPFWNELLYLSEVNIRPGPTPLEPAHEEIVRARQTVVERILFEQVGEWHSLSAFIARTKLHAPYLLFPRQYGARAERYSSGSNPYGWDFRLRRGWLTHREGWHMVEGGFIRSIITGPLHWLGVVELDSEESPTTFRQVSATRTFMGDAPLDEKEEPGGRLIVQPNFELVALAPVSEMLLINLDRFAERVSLELIAQYRLTRASVTRAIQLGLHAETILQALEHAAGGEIPQNVRYSLVEWERQARRVEIWQGSTLLEVDDAALLDTLFASEKTRRLFGRRLAECLAEVAPHQLSAVQEILWQHDYLPALASTQDISSENGRMTAREPQWRLHDDGLLQPFYAVLDLYLAAEVEHFSERDELTGWHRITRASLQQALASGLLLEHIVHFLQQYCEGGIPGSFLIRLKLWGSGYGEAQSIQVEQAPLLYLPAQVLQDLQADEELKLLLGAEIKQQNSLVRVEAEHLERVVELLRERGFTVE